jgi:hypothetical protein
MSEPDWDRFVIDPLNDPAGAQLVKLKRFMAAFILWRRDEAKKKPAGKRGKKK